MRLPHKTTPQRPKVVRTPGAFNVLTSKCASLPQRRALFRHLNFQKWSGPGVLCAFSLRNVLRATMPCTFSTSQLPKVLRMVCFVHFDFEMCFVPQRRALFRHLNFQFCTFDFETCFAPQRCVLLQHLNIQKCSEREVFCTF